MIRLLPRVLASARSSFSTSQAVMSRLETIRLIENTIKKFNTQDEVNLFPAQFDWSYLLDEKNSNHIRSNIKNRKSKGDLDLVLQLFKDIDVKSKKFSQNDMQVQNLIEKLYMEAAKLPNKTHELSPIGDYNKCECVLKTGEKLTRQTPTIDRIADLFGWIKEEAYILRGELADLETALIKYTLKYLNSKGFIQIMVPDILHHLVIESCGFATRGERNQVYKIDYANEYGKYCLSGTSEMSLAGLLKNRVFNESELPLKLCAVSRCYRAEVSGSEIEGKLYRLHEFTKVEMFVISPGSEQDSNKLLQDLKSYQIDMFSDLGLHFRVLDMSTEELGAPAYRKYDIEAWLPGNQFYGEISSTSNCIDYQSRRLNIQTSANKLNPAIPKSFAHTLNGTACAVPRMLTAIVESNWDAENNRLNVPEKLRVYMNNKSFIQMPTKVKRAKALHSFK